MLYLLNPRKASGAKVVPVSVKKLGHVKLGERGWDPTADKWGSLVGCPRVAHVGVSHTFAGCDTRTNVSARVCVCPDRPGHTVASGTPDTLTSVFKPNLPDRHFLSIHGQALGWSEGCWGAGGSRQEWGAGPWPRARSLSGGPGLSTGSWSSFVVVILCPGSMKVPRSSPCPAPTPRPRPCFALAAGIGRRWPHRPWAEQQVLRALVGGPCLEQVFIKLRPCAPCALKSLTPPSLPGLVARSVWRDSAGCSPDPLLWAGVPSAAHGRRLAWVE